MKKTYFVLTLVICSSLVSIAENVDYNDLQYNSFDTYQTWDFGDDEQMAPILPALPDGEPNWINNFGQPLLVDVNYIVPQQFQHLEGIVGWMYDYSQYAGLITERRCYYGGMGDLILTFIIPDNVVFFNSSKDILLEMIFWGRNDGIKNYKIEASPYPDFSGCNSLITIEEAITELDEPEGDIGKWYKLTAKLRFKEQLTNEYIRLTAYRYPVDPSHFMGGAAIIDEVKIITEYINIADIDGSGFVNMRDFAYLALDWQKDSGHFISDLNNDENVDLNDLLILCSNWLFEE